MFYKGLRRGILIFYANTFKLLTSKHMRLQKGDSNMQFQLQFITDELPQTPVHINQRTAVRGVIHYQNKILMVQTNCGDYKFPGGGMEEGETEKETLLREITEETGYTDIHIGVKTGSAGRLRGKTGIPWNFCDCGGGISEQSFIIKKRAEEDA